MIENPSIKFPVKHSEITYIKPTIVNKKKIIVGDYSYYNGHNFEKQVTNCYPWYKEKLIIGKFCSIAKGVEFMMNGANHHTKYCSTYPFYIFDNWFHIDWKDQPLNIKGDTIIGNDVWIGQDAKILPGVKIGDGAVIGAFSVVAKDVPPYAIAVGNPARVVKRRFSDAAIKHLLKVKWWNWSAKKIKANLKIIAHGTEKDIFKLK